MAADPTPFARALGLIPSGLFVLTVGRGDDASGVLVSFVQQIGFDPPAITVALRKGGLIEPQVRQAGCFALSILDEDCRKLMAHFARGFDAGEPAFDGVATAESAHGIPYPSAAQAHLACEIIGEADWSDHVVFCGRVVDGAARDGGSPLVHIRKNGLSY